MKYFKVGDLLTLRNDGWSSNWTSIEKSDARFSTFSVAIVTSINLDDNNYRAMSIISYTVFGDTSEVVFDANWNASIDSKIWKKVK